MHKGSKGRKWEDPQRHHMVNLMAVSSATKQTWKNLDCHGQKFESLKTNINVPLFIHVVVKLKLKNVWEGIED